MGRFKFYCYDVNIKYNKYKKLSIEDFTDCALDKIDYFFTPCTNDVDLESLSFNFLNERAIFNKSNVMTYQGSYYLWLYIFSYMEYLPENIKKIFEKYGEKNATKITMDFLKNWFDNNTLSSKPTWYPYAVSKRLEYLLKSYSLMDGSLNKEDIDYFKYWICVHKSLLEDNLETYIGYNHLLQNYKSLILTNMSVGNSKESLDYLDRYINQLKQEVDDDGCYIEKTPMYQLQIILDILDILNAINKISYAKRNIFLKYVIEMTNYLLKIEEPNGYLPMLNDTSLNYPVNWKIAKSDILAEVNKFKKFLETENNISNTKNEFCNLKESGIIIVNTKSLWILSENGSLGAKDVAGHGHADNLMFLLTLRNGKKIFVDPGIGTYNRGYHRDLFRSTMMHNTLSINRCNSSEIWSDFRVGKEVNPILHDCKINKGLIQITGKVKWSSGEIHIRKISIDKNYDSLKIIDKVQRISNNNRIYVNFVLHPDVKCQISRGTVILDTILELKNKNYDYIVVEKVPYSEDWGQFTTTNRISFIKDNYVENDEMEIYINKF